MRTFAIPCQVELITHMGLISIGETINFWFLDSYWLWSDLPSYENAVEN